MSRRKEIQFTPDELTEFLQQQQKASLSSIDKDGFPHIVAMGYLAKDGLIYMASYGKSQKVANIRRNPKVGVMMEDGDTYASFRGVLIRGYCEIIEDAERVRTIMHAMLAKQTGKTVQQAPPKALDSAPKRALLQITPEKITTWDHTKLGGKY